MQSFQFTAALSAALFSGAAIYITLVEHPARMECGTELAAREFGPSYRRATYMQVSLALIATIGGIGAWLAGSTSVWLGGAALIFSVIPYTLIVIMPTNHKLMEPSLDRASGSTGKLLRRWGRLHAMRSLVSLTASLVFLASLVWE
jgi:hypothetical protein